MARGDIRIFALTFRTFNLLLLNSPHSVNHVTHVSWATRTLYSLHTYANPLVTRAVCPSSLALGRRASPPLFFEVYTSPPDTYTPQPRHASPVSGTVVQVETVPCFFSNTADADQFDHATFLTVVGSTEPLNALVIRMHPSYSFSSSNP